MMTTDRPARAADERAVTTTNTRLLVRAAVLTVALGVVGAAVGTLLDGRSAGAGVLVGTALVVVVLVGGSLVVDTVAGLLPVASLLVALLTFTLQVVLVLLVLVALDGSGQLGTNLDRAWLGGAVIGATMLWLAVQVRLHATARVPAYELGGDVSRRADEGGH